MPYDPTKPYLTGEPIDAYMVAALRRRIEDSGMNLPLSDTELLKLIRAVQDAAVHIGGNIDPVESIWGVIRTLHCGTRGRAKETPHRGE